jgi:hypothetical protein
MPDDLKFDEELDLPSLYWIPKVHKCHFKQRYIAGSAKCSTEPLSKLLTYILSAVKTSLQSYCREVKCFNAIVGGEGPRLYVL